MPTLLVSYESMKIDYFKQGLSTKLHKALATSKCTLVKQFMGDCITQENINQQHQAIKNRKHATEASQLRAQGAQKAQYRPQVVQYRPPQKQARTNLPKKVFCRAFSNALPKGSSGQSSSGASKHNLPCINCNQTRLSARMSLSQAWKQSKPRKPEKVGQ